MPARDLLPNADYIRYGKRKYGYSITTVMSTRGCPFRCEFCSNVVFGGSYRERSAANVVDEIEGALGAGYDRISFADDVFTLSRRRVGAICDEIQRRGLSFRWECLGRVDALDFQTALDMKAAGCTRIYFGVESGDDRVLEQMNKRITRRQAQQAIEDAHRAGLEVGAFFIVCYPGQTDESVLETLRFACSLPLDYLGLTMPYPLPGTALYERVRHRMPHAGDEQSGFSAGQLAVFEAEASRAKMRFAIVKGQVQFRARRLLGPRAGWLQDLFERSTDAVFRWLE